MSGTLDWWFITDVSGLLIDSIFKGQAIQEDGAGRLTRNVSN